LGTLPVVLGYHLEWELSGEVVSRDTDKSKEPEKRKPIWQVPSKEVVKIFDGANQNWNIGPKPKNRTLSLGTRCTNLAAGVAPEEKDLC
jgi:hypothetical protein